jgi:hypothetical protein
LFPGISPPQSPQPEPSYPQPQDSYSQDSRPRQRTPEPNTGPMPAYAYPAQPSWRQQRADGAVVVRPDLSGNASGDGWAAAQSQPLQPEPAPRSGATDASGEDLSVPRAERPERGWPIIRGNGG